jgi:hypothetical protein
VSPPSADLGDQPGSGVSDAANSYYFSSPDYTTPMGTSYFGNDFGGSYNSGYSFDNSY